MGPLYKFDSVQSEDGQQVYSFVLNAGQIRLLQVASRAEKDAVIDLALGRLVCNNGSIEFAQGERRHRQQAVPTGQERRHNSQPLPVIWRKLMPGLASNVAWVAAQGGLISNLKVWENITLPLWYASRRDVDATEKELVYWLEIMGLPHDMFAEFMAAPPYRLEMWQRKFAGLLRALLHPAKVMVVDATVFEEVEQSLVNRWAAALDAYAAQSRTVLVVSDKAMALPWEKIE